MKFKAFVFAVLFLAGFATVEAQVSKKGKMDVNQRTERQTQQMASELSLSDKQVAEVKVVNEKYAKKMQDLRANTEDRVQLRTKMQELRQAQEKEVNQYLTKEQIGKWNQIKKQKKGRRTEMMQERKAKQRAQPNRKAMERKQSPRKVMSPQQKAVKRTEQMTKELGLSAEQAQQIEAIYAKYGAKKADYQRAKTPESREEMKQSRMEERKAIEAVLTKAQIAKRDELKAQKKAERAKKKKAAEAKRLNDIKDSDDSDNN